MFSNFIYFIVVLLIYATYQSPENTNFPPGETFTLFVSSVLIFAFFTRVQFYRLEKQILRGGSLSYFDHKLGNILTRQAVMAIVLFTIDVYGLNLTSFSSKVYVLSKLPTLEALLLLLLFVGYLSIVWHYAYDAYQKLYGTDMSRRSYVVSNISFAVPILLPWLLLSGVADIINIQPFELPRRLLATTEGEIAYFLFFLFVVVIIGPLLIQKFWRCKPLEPGYDRSRIEILCKRAGLEYADILYWPIFEGRMITAGVMGLVKKFRYILVTDALLSMLKPEEVDAVISHEIGHIKKKHLHFYLFFFVGYMLLSYAAFDLLIYTIIYTEPVYHLISSMEKNQALMMSVFRSVVMILTFLIYFRYIFGYFMRNFERQADTYVYHLSDSAAPLISTFEKIALTSGQPPDKPNWHHFSIMERMMYLKKCETDRHWITRHDMKIKKSIAVYVVSMLLLGSIVYSMNMGETGKQFNHALLEKVLMREIAKRPDDSNLYSLLGDFRYEARDYAATITAYESSIRLEPDNPYVLNNLAWLYAACKNEKFRNPSRAVVLAQKAAELSVKPHILDTLAESYYVNEQFSEAVHISEQALELADEDRSYYESQLKKFKDAEKKHGSKPSDYQDTVFQDCNRILAKTSKVSKTSEVLLIIETYFFNT